MEVVKIKSSVPLVKVLELIQRKRPHESCDTHLICQDGYIPCHRYILMANSSLLKKLINENLEDVGNPEFKTVISLSFPDIKTAHMALVVGMFYSGNSVCKLDDLFYVMNILKLIGIDFGDQSQLQQATKEEIGVYCKPRYYIDPDSDSEDEDSTTTNFTTNAFEALAQRNEKAAKKSDGKTQQECSTSKVEPAENNDSISTNKDNVDDSADMEVDSHVDEETPCPQPLLKENPIQPKVTPISIKALMDKQIARKRGRPYHRKDPEEKETKPENKNDTHESTKISSKDKPERKKLNGNPKESEVKDKSESSEDDEGNSNSSDDSVLESVKRLSTLRTKRVEKPESVSTRHTPVRSCRKTAEGYQSKTEIPSAMKKPNEECGSSRKPKQVLFSFNSDDDEGQKDKPKEVKCYFCSEIFANGEVLGKHLREICGTHLNGKYSRSKQQCLMCDKHFPTLNLWGLVRHVHLCVKVRSSPSFPKRKVSETAKAPNEVPTPANRPNKGKPGKVKETEKAPQNKKPESDDDDDVCSEEEIQVLDSLKVKVFRHNFPKEKESVKEIKVDPVPEKLVISAPDGSIASNSCSVQKTHVKKSEAPIENNSETLKYDKKSIVCFKYNEKLRDCRFCMEPHSSISEATNCLSDHGYAMCWICFQTYDSPTLAGHYKDCHETENKPNLVPCPICQSHVKVSDLRDHMKEVHLSSLPTSEYVKKVLEIHNNDKKRKREEDVYEKSKRVVADFFSSNKKPSTVTKAANVASTVEEELPEAVAQNDVAKKNDKSSSDNMEEISNTSINSELNVNWDEIDIGIAEYRKTKEKPQEVVPEKEVVPAEKPDSNLVRNPNARAGGETTSVVATLTTKTDVQLFQPPKVADTKIKSSPSLVADRLRQLMNEPATLPPMPSTSRNVVIHDGTKPSTSRAAMMSLNSTSPSSLMPLDYSTPRHQPVVDSFAAGFTIPKVPALDGRRTVAKVPSSQARGPDSIVNRNSQGGMNFRNVIPNPKPGDRLYCGIVAVENQNFRCFKVHADNGEPRVPPEIIRNAPSTQSNASTPAQSTSDKDEQETSARTPDE